MVLYYLFHLPPFLPERCFSLLQAKWESIAYTEILTKVYHILLSIKVILLPFSSYRFTDTSLGTYFKLNNRFCLPAFKATKKLLKEPQNDSPSLALQINALYQLLTSCISICNYNNYGKMTCESGRSYKGTL